MRTSRARPARITKSFDFAFAEDDKYNVTGDIKKFESTWERELKERKLNNQAFYDIHKRNN